MEGEQWKYSLRLILLSKRKVERRLTGIPHLLRKLQTHRTNLVDPRSAFASYSDGTSTVGDIFSAGIKLAITIPLLASMIVIAALCETHQRVLAEV